MYNIVIIDDQLPYDIHADNPAAAFASDKFEEWIKNKDWKEEVSLKGLIERIIISDLYKHREIDIIGFLYPAALVKYLKTSEQPQLIIFDWEYLTMQKETKKDLVEIINNTSNSYIFIYTAQAESIWQLLVGEVFEKNLNRLQLLLKGDKKLSLFTSEDNIMQYIISNFKTAYEFKMGEHSVRFEENDFIKSPSEILSLESILGKDFLFSKLKESNFELSNKTINNIFSDVKIKFYLSKDHQYLLESNIKTNEEKFGPLLELSFLEALAKYKIKVIDKTLERGIAKIDL